MLVVSMLVLLVVLCPLLSSQCEIENICGVNKSTE